MAQPRIGAVDGGIDQRRHHHATQRRHGRQNGLAPVGQFTDHEFALDLQADEEEEHRHPQVVDPHHQRLGQLQQAANADFARAGQQAQVGIAPGRVAQHQRQRGGQRQGQAAGRFARGQAA
jgi:hypothetical protein